MRTAQNAFKVVKNAKQLLIMLQISHKRNIMFIGLSINEDRNNRIFALSAWLTYLMLYSSTQCKYKRFLDVQRIISEYITVLSHHVCSTHLVMFQSELWLSLLPISSNCLITIALCHSARCHGDTRSALASVLTASPPAGLCGWPTGSVFVRWMGDFSWVWKRVEGSWCWQWSPQWQRLLASD